MRSLGALAALGLIAIGCGPFPRDPQGSFDAILERGTLRVGIQEQEPWIIRTPAGEVAGVEAELVAAFAKELGVVPAWHWGGAEQHFDALSRCELDLVAGGITEANAWRRHVAFTLVYYTSNTDVGVPASHPPLTVLEGVRVAVRPASSLQDVLRERGAEPWPSERPDEAGIAAAAETWQLRAWKLRPLGLELRRQRHVMAVPPGENRLLLSLGDFLKRVDAEALDARLALHARDVEVAAP